MDKYEMKLKIEQIKQLAEKKSYAEAAKIAKELSWYKVKDWSALSTAIEVHEAVGDYEEAKDMAILAYNRNLGGKKLVYKLIEIMIKCKQFDDAEELYEDYVRMASRDVNRFVLNYKLKKAQQASPNELVEILEDYKEQEVDEKYMYELALLYNKTKRKDECVKACDDIILMFQDGEYVDKAIALKKELGVPLTVMQKQIEKKAALNKEDVEAKKEELFMKQHEVASNSYNEIDDIFEEKIENPDIDEELAPTKVQIDIPDITDVEEEKDWSEDLADEDEVIEIPEVEEDEFYEETLKEEAKLDGSEDEVNEALDIPVFKNAPKGSSKMPEALRTLIENARKQMDEKYDSLMKEAEAEKIDEEKVQAQKNIKAREEAMDIEVQVTGNSIYDTQNIQAEIAKNMSTLLEEDEDLLRFKPQDKAEQESKEEVIKKPISGEDVVKQDVSADGCESDDQIEGQMSIMDWMEAVKEEKYSNQDTREFSRAEIERMLEEKDEKSAAYEKLMEKQKAEGVSPVIAERNAHFDMAIQSAKTDLAFRTGKASLKLEEAQLDIKAKSEDIVVKTDNKVVEKESAIATEEDITQIVAPQDIEVSLDTARFEPISEETLEAFVQAELAAAQLEDSNESAFLETPIIPDLEEDEDVVQEAKQVERDNLPTVSLEDFDEEEKKLTGELAKIFRKYTQMPGLEAQLFDYFATLDNEMRMTNSTVGNIIISGNSSSDKTDLARCMVRAINYLYPDNNKKIAKTSGDSINHRGIAKAMGKLRGTALIVEGAGIIQPKRMSEIISCLEQDTDRMIVILEDSDAEINVLVNFNPDMVRTFNHRIVLKQYTVNELVEMARKFARKRQYEVDDDALLELYLKIDKLHSVTDNIKIEDIKEIINDAIARSEKRAARKLFGGLKKKRSTKGDRIFLTEADFRE